MRSHCRRLPSPCLSAPPPPPQAPHPTPLPLVFLSQPLKVFSSSLNSQVGFLYLEKIIVRVSGLSLGAKGQVTGQTGHKNSCGSSSQRFRGFEDVFILAKYLKPKFAFQQSMQIIVRFIRLLLSADNATTFLMRSNLN